MDYYNPKIIRQARIDKKVHQKVLAEKLKMPLSTYSLREREGGFTTVEINILSRILGISEQAIFSGQKPVAERKIIKDSVSTVLENQVQILAMLRVQLSIMAEIIASQQNRSVSTVQSEIKKLVNDEVNNFFESKQKE